MIPNYHNVELNFCSVNLLLGPNSSGKTKFLETIHAFLNYSFRRTRDTQSKYNDLMNSLFDGNKPDEIFLELNRENIPLDWYQKPNNIPEKIKLRDAVFHGNTDIEYKYITAEKGFSSQIDTRETDRQLEGRSEKRNTSDIMAEISKNKKLIAQIQFEIENLFGIRISKEEIDYRGF